MYNGWTKFDIFEIQLFCPDRVAYWGGWREAGLEHIKHQRDEGRVGQDGNSAGKLGGRQ